jgi:integrase
VTSNPAANTTPPRVRAPSIEPPEVDKVIELLRLADEAYPEFGRFLHLAVTTGARRGELCALKWERIDWEAQTLTISRSIVEVQGGLVEKDTKTHSIRRIALDEQTLDVLADYRRHAEKLADEAGCTVTDSGYVFTLDSAGTVPFTPDHATNTSSGSASRSDWTPPVSTTSAISQLVDYWPPAFRSARCPVGWVTPTLQPRLAPMRTLSPRATAWPLEPSPRCWPSPDNSLRVSRP